MKRLFFKPDGCEEAEALIQRSLDEPLTASERQRLDRHVAACDSCRLAWDEYRRLSRAASQWLSDASTDPGDEFTQRIMAELGLSATHTPLPDPASTPGKREPRPARLVWGIVCAGIVAALVVAGLFLPSPEHWRGLADAYTPSVSMPAGPSTVAQWWSTVRPQAGEIAATVQSWTWPLYAFAGALVANVALVLSVRRGRRLV